MERKRQNSEGDSKQFKRVKSATPKLSSISRSSDYGVSESTSYKEQENKEQERPSKLTIQPDTPIKTPKHQTPVSETPASAANSEHGATVTREESNDVDEMHTFWNTILRDLLKQFKELRNKLEEPPENLTESQRCEMIHQHENLQRKIDVVNHKKARFDLQIAGKRLAAELRNPDYGGIHRSYFEQSYLLNKLEVETIRLNIECINAEIERGQLWCEIKLERKEGSAAANRSLLLEMVREVQAAHKQLCNDLKEASKHLLSTHERFYNRYGTNCPYSVSVSGKKFINELRLISDEQISQGIRLLRMTCGIDPDGEKSPFVFIRSCVDQVAKQCVDDLQLKPPHSRAVILGSPGIGKTRSGHPAILQYLMELGVKRVMYANRTTKWYTLFEREDDGSYSSTETYCTGTEPTAELGPDDWLLVDPSENGNDIESCKGRLILIVSPNKKHYHNWMKDGTQFYHIWMWTEEELSVITQFLNVESLDEEELRYRFECIGGAPRYIYSTYLFSDRLKNMEANGLKMDADKVADLFVTTPASSVEEKGVHLPSLFVTYVCNEELRKSEPSLIYKDCNAVLVSSYAKLLVVRGAFRRSFDLIVKNEDPERNSYHGVQFENLVLAMFSFGSVFSSRKLSMHKHTGSRRPQTQKMDLGPATLKFVTRQKMLHLIKNSYKMRSSTDPYTVYRPPANFPFIDAIDNRGRVFQMTLNTKHKMVLTDDLTDVMKSLGSLEMFFVLPDTTKYEDATARKIDDTKLHRIVRQKVLFVTEQPRGGNKESRLISLARLAKEE